MDKTMISKIIGRMLINEKYKYNLPKVIGIDIIEIIGYLEAEEAKGLFINKAQQFFNQEEKLALIERVMTNPETVKTFKLYYLPQYLYGYFVNQVYEKHTDIFSEFLIFNIDNIKSYKFTKLNKEIKPIIESVILMTEIN